MPKLEVAFFHWPIVQHVVQHVVPRLIMKQGNYDMPNMFCYLLY